MMDYKEAVGYIEEIPKFTKKHTLEHTREFLKRLGSPEAGKKIIHVAGTNGKGSVCAYMQAILSAEGKHVGFFTSPHLVCINERIQVNGIQIEDDAFLDVFQKVKQVVDGMGEEGIAHPSYFEFLFGMGMLAFARADVEYIILETGLGGRLDATNAVAAPLLTVITSISLDHTQYLGDTIEKIAIEKAGIIKEGVPVICDGSDETALLVIRRQADKMGADCREISKNAFKIREITDKHIAFSRVNAYDDNVIWHLTGCGIFQIMNAEIAITAMEYVLGEPFHYDKWKEALSAVTWDGRMEEVMPDVFIDGAHNLGAVTAFVESVQMLEHVCGTDGAEGRTEPVILFSAVADKEYEKMIAFLCQELPAKVYVVTEVEDGRRVPAKELGEIFKKYTSRKVVVQPKLEQAWETAMEMKDTGGKVYCLGSLYLVGMVKERLDRR